MMACMSGFFVQYLDFFPTLAMESVQSFLFALFVIILTNNITRVMAIIGNKPFRLRCRLLLRFRAFRGPLPKAPFVAHAPKIIHHWIAGAPHLYTHVFLLKFRFCL